MGKKTEAPIAWFVLEKESGKPYIDSMGVEDWGQIPIPVFGKDSIRPGYTNPFNMSDHPTSVRLNPASIEQAMREAGKLAEGDIYFPPNLVGMNVYTSCGKLLLNICRYNTLADYGSTALSGRTAEDAASV